MSGINTSQLAQRIPNAQRSQPGLAHQRSPNSVPMGAPRPGGPAARVAISPAGQAAVNGAAVTTVVTAGRFLAVTIQNDAADIQSVTSGASINAGTTTLLLKLPKLAQGVRYQLASLSLSSSPGTRIAYSLIDSKGVARSITPGNSGPKRHARWNALCNPEGICTAACEQRRQQYRLGALRRAGFLAKHRAATRRQWACPRRHRDHLKSKGARRQ